MNDPSGSSVLSAVARRKAAQLEANSVSEYSSSILVAVAAAEPVISVNEPPALPLKRKSSVRSLNQLENSERSKTEPQLRKRSKPQRYFQSFANKEGPSTSATPRREYSPSQPLADSSDEDAGTAPNEMDTDLVEIDENEEIATRIRCALVTSRFYSNLE